MTDDYRPRFTFEIDEDQQRRVNRLLSVYGLKKTIFSIILDDFLDIVEEHGPIVFGLILDRHAKPKDILPTLKQADMKAKEVKDVK